MVLIADRVHAFFLEITDRSDGLLDALEKSERDGWNVGRMIQARIDVLDFGMILVNVRNLESWKNLFGKSTG